MVEVDVDREIKRYEDIKMQMLDRLRLLEEQRNSLIIQIERINGIIDFLSSIRERISEGAKEKNG